MDLWIVPFLTALVLVPVTLLPIINPLGTAPVFVAEFGANRSVAKRLARQIAINSWFVLVSRPSTLKILGLIIPTLQTWKRPVASIRE